MKNLLTIFMLSAMTVTFAQDFKVPQDYTLKTADDYAQYEEEIIQCVDWLMETPANEQKSKRKEASGFLITWLTGSPNVSVELNSKIITFMEPNSELLVIYMGTCTKYILETKDDNKVKCCLTGIENVIAFYEKNKAYLEKDKNVEKYIKMKEKGTLEQYLKDCFKISNDLR